jgi:hypothetical protein
MNQPVHHAAPNNQEKLRRADLVPMQAPEFCAPAMSPRVRLYWGVSIFRSGSAEMVNVENRSAAGIPISEHLKRR